MHPRDKYHYVLIVWFGQAQRTLRTTGAFDRVSRMMFDPRLKRLLLAAGSTGWAIRQEAVRHAH